MLLGVVTASALGSAGGLMHVFNHATYQAALFMSVFAVMQQTGTTDLNKLGGLIEFYRSPARVRWSPTGTNVPDYPKLAQLWWPNVADAVSGAVTPQAAMDALAAQQDRVLERLERAGIQKKRLVIELLPVP